ncbi:MAG: hypothetical protein LC789_10085, partial [Actinobacteria bacterium]|nr:hypothetical protein [Actinomycetota bacterium]
MGLAGEQDEQVGVVVAAVVAFDDVVQVAVGGGGAGAWHAIAAVADAHGEADVVGDVGEVDL